MASSLTQNAPQKIPMTKKTTSARRTKRGATAVLAVGPDRIPAGFITETETARILQVAPGTLRNYRYRWTNNLPGEKGPQWFEGFGRRIRYRKSDVIAWRDRMQQWTPKGGDQA